MFFYVFQALAIDHSHKLSNLKGLCHDRHRRIGDKPSLVHILEELTVFQKVLHGGEICQSPLVMGSYVWANVIQNLERTIPYPISTLVSPWAWLTTLEEAFQDAKAGISEVQIANQRCPYPKGCAFQGGNSNVRCYFVWLLELRGGALRCLPGHMHSDWEFMLRILPLTAYHRHRIGPLKLIFSAPSCFSTFLSIRARRDKVRPMESSGDGLVPGTEEFPPGTEDCSPGILFPFLVQNHFCGLMKT